MKLELIGTEKECAGLHRIHAAHEKDEKGNPLNAAPVQFVDGVAECEDNLGQYLIDKGFARLSGKEAGNAKATVAAEKAKEKAAE